MHGEEDGVEVGENGGEYVRLAVLKESEEYVIKLVNKHPLRILEAEYLGAIMSGCLPTSWIPDASFILTSSFGTPSPSPGALFPPFAMDANDGTRLLSTLLILTTIGSILSTNSSSGSNYASAGRLNATSSLCNFSLLGRVYCSSRPINLLSSSPLSRLVSIAMVSNPS